MTTVGGDQRDRSSTAAVSFTQDSELIGQIDIQRYVNSLQSTGSCSLARWAARASTEKQARSGKRHRGSGLSIRCRRHLQAGAGQQAVSHLRLFVGRRPFSSAATTIDVAPPLRGTRTARCDLQRERRKTAAHSRGSCSDKFFLFAGELKAYLAGPAITVILGTRISACRPTDSREDCRRLGQLSRSQVRSATASLSPARRCSLRSELVPGS